MVSLGLGSERNFGKIRFRVLTWLVALALTILIGRLYVLQVRRHQEFREKSESNFIQLRRVPHERGIMKDRDGRIVVDNRPSHDVTITPAFLPTPRLALSRVFRAAGISDELPGDQEKGEKKIKYDSKNPKTSKSAKIAEELEALVKARSADPIVLEPSIEGARLKELEKYLSEQREQRQMSGLELLELEPGRKELLLHPMEFASRPLLYLRLRDLLELSEEGINDIKKEVTSRQRGLDSFAPITVRQNLSWEQYVRLEHATSLGDLPGVDVVESVIRQYREGPRAAHVFGYLNEISPQELEDAAKKEDPSKKGYKRGDYLGRRGLERAFETQLRGEDGTEKVVVDAKGRRINDRRSVGLLGDDRLVPAKPGEALILTIDMDLQRAAEQAFRGKAGAVVAVEVATGSILAMASFPAYDPNIVSGRMTGEQKRRLDTDPLQPWINKTVQQHYAPGSTFKVLTAIAGLLEGKITADTYQSCPGFFALGRTTWRCFNRYGHGPIALRKSIQVSCDSYYYRLGYALGGDALARHVREFGLGARTGITLDGEIPGIIPDEKYYEQRFGANSPGYVVNNAIGQGDVNVTPLQLAMAYTAIVNGGILWEPRLLERTEDRSGHILRIFPPKPRAKVTMPNERAMNDIMLGMSEVVKPGGTASGVMWQDNPPGLGLWLRTSGIAMGGKTGTAQVARLSKSVMHVDAEKQEYLRRDHAWFAGFAPVEKPEIVVVTLTEHGGFGGAMSAPVSAAVMRAYFEKKGFHARPELAVARAPVVQPKEEELEAHEDAGD